MRSVQLLYVKSSWFAACVRERKRVPEYLFHPLHTSSSNSIDCINANPVVANGDRIFKMAKDDTTKLLNEEETNLRNAIDQYHEGASSSKQVDHSLLCKGITENSSLYYSWLLQQELFEQVKQISLLKLVDFESLVILMILIVSNDV